MPGRRIVKDGRAVAIRVPRRRRSAERPRYTCPECGEDFGYAEGVFTNHMETRHGREMPRYGCAICGRDDFLSQRGVEIHQARHTNAEVEAAQNPPPEDP